MEPLSTALIVNYIGKQLTKNKDVNQLFKDCTAGTVAWLRKKIFLSDNFKKLKEKPESEIKRENLIGTLKGEIEDDPKVKAYIQELFEKIEKTEEGETGKINIKNSKNVVVGSTIHVGKNFSVGDNNSAS